MEVKYKKCLGIGCHKKEECKRYKEWCDLRPSDYMKLLDNCTRALKDELECTERFYKNKIAELEQKKVKKR